jgi:mono/diheme cytochrome c family protein
MKNVILWGGQWMKNRHRIISISVFLALFLSESLFAKDIQIGEREFKYHCAGCHGLDGKGNGTFVEFLNTKPKDLTTLAMENEGVFPFNRVYEIIDGRYQIGAHGTTDMPVWGDRFSMDIIRQYGEYNTEQLKTVRCRILELVFFLATIQETKDTVIK